MRNFLIGFFIFALAFFVGAIFRVGWLYGFQRPLFQYTYLDADIRATKTGGKTPQDAWNKYIGSLEKGDINGALAFVHPNSRDGVRKHLEELKKKNLLSNFGENYAKELKNTTSSFFQLKRNEKSFDVQYIEEKKIDYIGIKDDLTKKTLDFFWSDQATDRVTTTDNLVFFYNRYSRLWLIK